jgi:hypothetical protein
MAWFGFSGECSKFAFRIVGWQKRPTLDWASMAPFRPLRAGVGSVGLAFADGIVPVMAAAAAARYRCQIIRQGDDPRSHEQIYSLFTAPSLLPFPLSHRV